MTLHERSEYLLKERMKKLHCKNKFNFVFLGDSRGNGPKDNCFTMSGEFELVLQRAAELDPLFIIHGGDTVYTGEKKYLEHFVRVVKKIVPHIPVFVCVGNHDELYLEESNLKNFQSTIGKVHWVIDIPNFKFRCIALNNIVSPKNKIYGFTNDELNYLERKLYHTPRNTVLAMHAQPNIGRWSTLEGFPVDTSQSQKFFDLIQCHHVKKVLVSHVHAYDEQFIRKNCDGTFTLGKGTDFILSGGAGAPLDLNPPLTLNDYNFTEFHVNRHDILGPILWRNFGIPKKNCI
ncbi:metallophosphoesterase [Bacillus cereus]|uniref:metallophosphoesterase family protein n=1 Tax=Bacillus thuringiensis TaxID=1428 RepID=UPI002A45788D|nr:metallophosphoesterase [Bacillus cereus]MDA2365681.1 metallophosphoesterase [Bacillus cereus]MDA2370941.1 metallophosphoesterase [Bacillus cereus]MDA2398455.1 metallophosphoesterase [Bacillus cereus]MDA2469191.1 metallophosphoesterase [Bacillus cereus]